jgi:hypothetical protein
MGKLAYGDNVEPVAIREIDKVYVSIHLYLRAKLLNYRLLYLAKLSLKDIQRVHKAREHIKLFIAQELHIIQTSYTCHFEEKL